MNGTQIFELVTGMLSGLALFMFGMNVMSDTLTQLAGGKLMIDQRIAQLSSLGFMVLLLSGVFDSLLSLVNGTVFGFFSNIAGALV